MNNFNETLDMIRLPDDITDWIATAKTVSRELNTNTAAISGILSGKIGDYNEKKALSKQSYQNFKAMGVSMYQNNESLLKDFGFSMRFPVRK